MAELRRRGDGEGEARVVRQGWPGGTAAWPASPSSRPARRAARVPAARARTAVSSTVDRTRGAGREEPHARDEPAARPADDLQPPAQLGLGGICDLHRLVRQSPASARRPRRRARPETPADSPARPMSDGSSTSNSPAVPSSRSQYGWLSGVLGGQRPGGVASRPAGSGAARSALLTSRGDRSDNAPPVQRTGTRERTIAVWRNFNVSPGTTSARAPRCPTSRPRHAWRIRSSCARLSLTTGSARAARRAAAQRSSAGTLAAGSCALNCAMTSSASRADLGAARHAAPRRVHAVEDVLRRRFAGEQLKRFGSAAPPPPRPPKLPKPCVLCMARLRPAMVAERIRRTPDRCRRLQSAS